MCELILALRDGGDLVLYRFLVLFKKKCHNFHYFDISGCSPSFVNFIRRRTCVNF